MKKSGVRGAALALASALCLTAGGLSASAATAETPVVSYGVNVLAAMTDMAVSAPVGNEIVFSADAFARALNLSEVRYITVKSIPTATEGELLLGSTRIVAGQTVAAQNLSYMTFEAATEDVTRASFTFTANGSPTAIVCNMYLTREINYTPTVSLASGLSLNVSTYKGLSAFGTLSAYDPDGDGLIFEIVSYPENGSVRLTDRELGTYVYTPNEGYVGSDRLTYVARDKFGNYSAAATVRFQIATSGTSVTYVDMEDSSAYAAALALTEAGIMSGTQVGSQYYFDPDGRVSRAEFLVMAMHAAGIDGVPDCKATIFDDDAEIPESMKGYVAAAYELGYVSGSLANGRLCFLPNEEITRAQAAVILGNLLDLADAAVTPTFADQSDIPVWAREAIYSLNAAGIMNGEQGYIASTEKLTRAQSARMLAAVMEYVE